MFYSAQEVLKSNQLFLAKDGKHDYLLRGLIKCLKCGKSFCGTYSRGGPARSVEKKYYRDNGSTQWRKLGMPQQCQSPSINANVIENIVWEDIKGFCKDPEVAITQLRQERQPVDLSIDAEIEKIDSEIADLKRQESNILDIAIKSKFVNVAELDDKLEDIRIKQQNLTEFRSKLETEKRRAHNIEKELRDTAEQLKALEEFIDKATFEERRKAVTQLVENIVVDWEIIDGFKRPIITVNYKFGEPNQSVHSNQASVLLNCTSAPASIMATHRSLAPALPPRSPVIRNESLARCSTGSTSTSRCPGWNMRS
jgi:site-specific DNA recombinase